jgi:hypothetical protein
MCASHWRKVPRAIQDEVYGYYRPGQCDDKKPSKEWHAAAAAAIGYVAMLEGHGLLKSEARELAARGYGDQVVEAHVRRHGEKYRQAAIKISRGDR